MIGAAVEPMFGDLLAKQKAEALAKVAAGRKRDAKGRLQKVADLPPSGKPEREDVKARDLAAKAVGGSARGRFGLTDRSGIGYTG
jgi:hypothetical protein